MSFQRLNVRHKNVFYFERRVRFIRRWWWDNHHLVGMFLWSVVGVCIAVLCWLVFSEGLQWLKARVG